MKSKDNETVVKSNEAHSIIESQPILSWKNAPQTADKAENKVVNMYDYLRSQEALSEASILSWNLPVMDDVKPVKLIMVSSGFKLRGLGANNIQSMVA